MSRGKPSAVQEAVQHTREIQHQLRVHLDNLEFWGPQFNLEVNIPELFADDAAHTAHITWGCNKSFKDAQALTELYAKDFVHPRLTVEFIGSVLIADDA